MGSMLDGLVMDYGHLQQSEMVLLQLLRDYELLIMEMDTLWIIWLAQQVVQIEIHNEHAPICPSSPTQYPLQLHPTYPTIDPIHHWTTLLPTLLPQSRDTCAVCVWLSVCKYIYLQGTIF